MLATTKKWLNSGARVMANSGSRAKPELEDTGSPPPATRLAARSGSVAELRAIIEKCGTRKKPMRWVRAGSGFMSACWNKVVCRLRRLSQTPAQWAKVKKQSLPQSQTPVAIEEKPRYREPHESLPTPCHVRQSAQSADDLIFRSADDAGSHRFGN